MRAIVIESPIGPLALASNGRALTRVHFQTSRSRAERDAARDMAGAIAAAGDDGPDEVLREATRELRAYFAGRLRVFSLEVDPAGTPFQRRVWATLRDIPFGDTRSYAELAREIDQPSAVRAVGAANGRNPIPIVIPCHRVIGSNGSLVGFGGGIAMKRYLLNLERGGLLDLS